MNDIMKQIERYLKEFLGDRYHYDPEEEAFVVFYGSTVIRISTIPFGNSFLVETMAFVVQDVEATPELMEHLLFLNYRIPLGAFSLVDSDIFYSHAILADHLSLDELEMSIAVVARMADDEDDYIVLKYGGERAIDKLARPTQPRAVT